MREAAIPSWVRVGAEVVCVDDNWMNDWGIDDDHPEGPFPVLHASYTIASWEIILGQVYLNVTEASVQPDLYELAAFRPLTAREQLERDVARFRGAFKAAVSPASAKVPETVR